MSNISTNQPGVLNELVDDPECQNCGSKNIIKDERRGERICSQCGLVLEDRMVDQGTEWRAYNNEEFEKRARTENLSYSLTKDLSTYIGYENKDALGQTISSEKQTQFFRMRRWQIRFKIQDSKAKNLQNANIELDRLCSYLQVPRSVKETAGQLYKKSVEAGMIKGYPINSMVAATVYAAARIRRVPRTLDEVSDGTQMTKKRLSQCYRLLVTRMNYKIPPTRSTDIILRLGTELGISSPTQQFAVDIINRAIEMKLSNGKDPSGMAASALYLAGIIRGEKRNQQLIAKTSHVTEVTIRNRCKDLMTFLGGIHGTKESEKEETGTII